MAPTPQEHSSTCVELLATEQVNGFIPDNERIVISGMSGLYPQAHNVKELSEILYNKMNPISSEDLRWDYKHPETTKYAGLAPDLNRFDAQFFTVYHRLANYMEPMSRKMLEHSYQAIYDAGMNPAQLCGKKVAVFIGSSYSITEYTGVVDYASINGLGIVGCSKTMFANRISYWLNVKGPSVAIDEGDCSTTVALEEAYSALRRGDCEAALVGGAYLSLHPHASIFHRRMGALSSDGKTKSFSADADGYTLSDAVGVIFLQKAAEALRVYAELKHVKNEYISMMEDKTGPKYGYYRDPQKTIKFIKDFYQEARVAPQAVEYVEAYGTGIPEADKSELEAIAEVYCKDRNEPLLVGSVTSNIGLTEAASGMASISKVLLGYYTGELAANMNCEKPRQDVEALRDGRIRIVTEQERLHQSYVALNGMSVTGVNSHVLLHGQYKPKDLSRYKSSIPRLVAISGRQESAVEKIFDDLKSRPIDAEELGLLHHIHSTNISGHLGRGYIILDTDANGNTVSVCQKAEYFNDATRPLWFVYSGMGSQWATMGTQLMRLPIFEAAIKRCHRVLESKGLDLIHIITSPDDTLFDNILNSFVGIAAIQIGLTDILRELGLVPDGIIGHSVGELGCAYADGCLTDEEMILAAYSRGLVSLETNLIDGSMAAVGLGYEEISKLCPPEIDVACHNGPESSTISGPAHVMSKFVAQLSARGIFAKEVPCSNIAYHSRYIADAGPNLLKYLKEVIKDPKPRSERWISSSVPQDRWNEPLAKYCSAEYQTNNLLSSVLFEETSRLIPSNAVTVEVAPHGLLQAILKRSLPADCRHVALTKRGNPDNALHLLQAIGHLYVEGYTPKVQALYPKIEFPVSTSTPMLSHLPQWVHSEEWTVFDHEEEKARAASSRHLLMSVHDVENSYVRGHIVRGKTCLPFSAALVAVWDTLAMCLDMPKKQLSVQFRNVYLYAQPLLHDQRPLSLDITLHRGTGQFEVISKHSRVASGYISHVKEKPRELRIPYVCSEDQNLTSQDVYQLLSDKEYSYSGVFKSIIHASASLNEAALKWSSNWATLIDGMLQLNVLRQPYQGVSLPSFIRRICIDIKEHYNNHKYLINDENAMDAHVDSIQDYTRCAGVLIHNIKFRDLPQATQDGNSLELVASPQYASTTNKNLAVATGVTLRSSQFGKLESLHWEDAAQVDSSNAPTVTLHYAGLNMLDVKKATGVTACDTNSYGMDYSGTTESGERVMGIVKSGAASTQVCAQPELLWPVPAHWSLEDAATVPLAYLQAFYCLKIKGQMYPGMNVLVHGGAGGLGQAAIAIALAHKCQVFATVGDFRKKQFLLKLFPQLRDDHVTSSRSSTFADFVLMATQGKGCNIVVSSVKGDLKNESLRCLAFSGRLIDTVQIENREIYEFGMFLLTRQRSYMAADISSIFTYNNTEDMRVLHAMLSEGIAEGYVRPLSRVTYAPQDVVQAFRLLAASRHRGRVLLRLQDNTTQAQHRITCDANKCHLMFWYDDVLGVQLADRLINRGAKKFYIHFTNPSTYHHFKIESWRRNGVEVVLSSENLTEAVTTVMNNAGTLGPVEGIYIVNTKSEDLSSILKNVDSASRKICPQLRYFLVASTTTSLSDDICAARTKSGLVATSLNLSSLIQAENYDSHVAVEAIDCALCSENVVLSARAKPVQSPSLLEQLAALADINIPENAGADDTLHVLGMADEKIPEICSFLNNTHSISLKEQDIPLLTLQIIKDLEESISDIIPPNTPLNTKGLDTFFSTTCSDELLATVDVTVLPTLFKNIAITNLEFDVSQRYLSIIPGMEGHHERFRVMCERLKLPALVLQPGLDHPHETVQDTAQRLADMLMKKGMVQNNFYILGYEIGVMVALELAAILEDQGLTGTVFCMGCAPDEFNSELEYQLSDLGTAEQLQDAVVRHMFKLLVNGETPDLDNALQKGTTWEQKIDICVRSLMGRMSHSSQYARALIYAALARIEQARCYQAAVKRRLRSQLVLIRALTAQAPPQQSSLQRYSQKPVFVHQLRCNLSCIAKDTQCASIINKYLDAETQNAYDVQNQCDTYFLLNL